MVWFWSLAIAAGFAAAIFIVTNLMAPKGWRTRIANILSLLSLAIMPVMGGLLQYLTTLPWSQLFDTRTAFLIAAAINLMNLVYREMTTTPAGQPVPEAPVPAQAGNPGGE